MTLGTLDVDRNERRLARRLEHYVSSILHIDFQLVPWDSRSLPSFLARSYQFLRGEIVGHSCLFMVLPETEAAATEVGKHVSQLEVHFNGVVVIVAGRMGASQRARLIEQGLAFIVPGNQLYIPQLAMDLRERFRRPERGRGDSLSPVAQAVLFHHLLRRHDKATPSELAMALRYSAMSVGRAFDELAARNLAAVEWRGREKTITYNAAPKLLLELSRTLLRPAYRGRHGVVFRKGRPDLMWAGESALSQKTDLSRPTLPTFAVPAAGWQILFEEIGAKDVHDLGDAEALIETWRYDPRVLSDGDAVDPFSLYAQFWNDPDERVAQAAEDLLETIAW